MIDVEHEPNIKIADIFEANDPQQKLGDTTINPGPGYSISQPGVQNVNFPWDSYHSPMRHEITVHESVKVSYTDPANPTSYSECTLKEYVEMKVMAALREIVEGK